jgi:ATP-dependent Clp protease ATP-binding subunit ClpA
LSDSLDKLRSLRDALESRIIGQREALNEITALLSRALCGFRYPDRPVASMLLLGPTGVGKTETARIFTQHLFGEESKLVRLDMSEYMTVDSIDILRGSHQGERGLFGYYYDRSARSGTLLFDEIEKAHPLIMDLFLQILSAARFTLATGETLDLSNFVVVATSNIGSRMLMESRTNDRETLVRRTLAAGTNEMRPETFARFDLHCVFNKLDYAILNKIGELHLDKCLGLINDQGHNITCEPGVVEYVQREGYSERFGARAMQNAVMRVLGNVVSAEMLKNGGRRVVGSVAYDCPSNLCFFMRRSGKEAVEL